MFRFLAKLSTAEGIEVVGVSDESVLNQSPSQDSEFKSGAPMTPVGQWFDGFQPMSEVGRAVSQELRCAHTLSRQHQQPPSPPTPTARESREMERMTIRTCNVRWRWRRGSGWSTRSKDTESAGCVRWSGGWRKRQMGTCVHAGDAPFTLRVSGDSPHSVCSAQAAPDDAPSVLRAVSDLPLQGVMWSGVA